MRKCPKCKEEVELDCYGKSHWCKTCCKSYRIENKDKIKKAKEKHYAKNRASILKRCKEDHAKYKKRIDIYNKKYSIENRGKINKKRKETYSKEPEKKLALNGKYRELKANGTSREMSKKDSDIIKEFYQEARRKEKKTGIKHHVDHIIPLSKGGTHTPENLQVLTARDNIIKGDSLVTI